MVKSCKPLTIFAKSSVLNVWLSSEYASDFIRQLQKQQCKKLLELLDPLNAKIFHICPTLVNTLLYPKERDFFKKEQPRKLFNTFKSHSWENIFKNGTSKICERQPLKKLKWYGLFCSLSVSLENVFRRGFQEVQK